MSLPYFTSNKPCPVCSELLHWSSANPPEVSYDTISGFVYGATLHRFCISCGYEETGYVSVNKDPNWTKDEKNA